MEKYINFHSSALFSFSLSVCWFGGSLVGLSHFYLFWRFATDLHGDQAQMTKSKSLELLDVKKEQFEIFFSKKTMMFFASEF